MFNENINIIVAPLSNCQHPGLTKSVQEGPNAGIQGGYLNHPLSLTLSNPGLVLHSIVLIYEFIVDRK